MRERDIMPEPVARNYEFPWDPGWEVMSNIEYYAN